MNKAQRDQRFNLFFFFFSLLMAILVFFATAFIAKEVLSGKVDNLPPSTDVCYSLIQSQGFNPKKEGQFLSAQRPAHSNIESMVSEVGTLLAMCPTYEIDTFCAGEGCELPGVSFKLKMRKD